MNKRTQKKAARHEDSGEGAHARTPDPHESGVARRKDGSPEHDPPAAAVGRGRAPERQAAVRAVAEQAAEAAAAERPETAVASVRAAAERVQERTTEAIGHARERLIETEKRAEALLRDARTQLRDKVSETERQAEALLRGAQTQLKGKVAETEKHAEALLRDARAQLKGKVAETKQRLAQREQRAEQLLEKLPLVGAAAAKTLHGLIHR